MNQVYGLNSKLTYHGGQYRKTKIIITNIKVNNKRISALISIGNKYVKKENFHLTFIDCIIAVVQLEIAYRCYKYKKKHSELGEGRLASFNIDFFKQIKKARDIPIEIREVNYKILKNIMHTKYRFNINEKSVEGVISTTSKID